METRLSVLEWLLCAMIASAARASTKRWPPPGTWERARLGINMDMLERRLLYGYCRGPIRHCVRCGDPFTEGPTNRDRERFELGECGGCQ